MLSLIRTTPVRLTFFGTAEVACPSLVALQQSQWAEVVAVVTQPTKPQGRALKLVPSPVQQAAERLGLQVLQPLHAWDEQFVESLRTARLDMIAVAAYGQILSQALLDVPRFGCLNVHTSLLPKYRGAAPIQWAILSGESETGVTIMKMDAGLDTGDVLTQRVVAIGPEDTAATLHARLGAVGADLLLETIPDYMNGTVTPRKQPLEGVSYARKIKKEDGRIDWTQSASVLWNRVRALIPWPGAFTYMHAHDPAHAKAPAQGQAAVGVNRVMLKIWRAETASSRLAEPGTILQADRHGILVACGTDALRLLEVQREGGRRLSTQEFLAGCRLRTGERLG